MAAGDGRGSMWSSTDEEVDMIDTKKKEPPQPGDLVVVHGHRVGEGGRTGEILEILGEPGHLHFKVRWEDGHESIFYPSNDAIIQSLRKGGAR